MSSETDKLHIVYGGTSILQTISEKDSSFRGENRFI